MDEQQFNEARPFIRTALAVMLWMTGRPTNIQTAYGKADVFIEQLREDLKDGK